MRGVQSSAAAAAVGVEPWVINELFGWVWIACGMLSGAVLGLFFHRGDWLGGYDAFPRRLVRLGHIAFLGLGFVNILFAFSLDRLRLDGGLLRLASICLIVGAMTMPLCCFLAAWKRPLKLLFPIPVAALLTGVITVIRGLWPSAAQGGLP